MIARTAVGLLLVALFAVLLVQLVWRRPVAYAAEAGVVSIEEIRQRLERAKAEYRGADREEFGREIDRSVELLRTKFGERVRVVDAIKFLREQPLPSGGLLEALLASGASSPTPAAANAGAPAVDVGAAPDGVSVERMPAGFVLRASCRSAVNAVLWVGLAGLLAVIPFVLWRDLIRGVWTDEGLSFWLTSAFLAAWGGGILYVASMGAMGIFGEIRVTKEGDRGEIFTGIGRAGWTHRLHWSEFQRVEVREVAKVGQARFSRIVQRVGLAGPGKSYTFGEDLTPSQRAFVVAFLDKNVFRADGTAAAGQP